MSEEPIIESNLAQASNFRLQMLSDEPMKPWYGLLPFEPAIVAYGPLGGWIEWWSYVVLPQWNGK